ncbi:MAG: small ribosomal subunit Rsm22 family protein, partial [Planctomycetota bacterium]
MPLPRDELERLQRLRELFLDEDRGAAPLPDYWRDARDLAAYDAVLGARIGWKWDAVLRECRDRGLARADGAVVLDWGCGTGVAARRFVAHFGAREVHCHDRSRAAMAFAVERLREQAPAVQTHAARHIDDLAPDVLLVSHVLGELDDAGRDVLRALIARSRTVILVEPGSRAAARTLSALRDEVLADFHVLAPCPHRGRCPTLANDHDWCHFFAAPPPAVFTTAYWAHAAAALGIDLRALPYSFVALSREPAAIPAPRQRGLGRADAGKHVASVQV